MTGATLPRPREGAADPDQGAVSIADDPRRQRSLGGGTVSTDNNDDIAACVRRSLERYFRDLDGEDPSRIYDMVLCQVEAAMLDVVMGQAGGNQSVAADMLGINRNTLRRKLAAHNLR